MVYFCVPPRIMSDEISSNARHKQRLYAIVISRNRRQTQVEKYIGNWSSADELCSRPPRAAQQFYFYTWSLKIDIGLLVTRWRFFALILFFCCFDFPLWEK